ncbi:MAG: glycosyltransferase [Acidobacteriota bacterium]|nr:glycosyltransferase [Acidobacteriota bacterium]
MRFGSVSAKVELMQYWGDGWRLKLNFAWFLLWCWWRVFKTNPNVVYVSDPIATAAGVLLLLTMKIPVIYHEHDSPFEVPRSGSEKVITIIRNLLAKKSLLCIIPSLTRAEEFSSAVRTKAPIIRVMNCPSLRENRETVSSGLKSDELKLYYHGSIVPERVPLKLLDALSLVSDKVTLTIAGYETIGNPGYVSRFRREARQRGLASRVRFEGPFPLRDALLKFCAEHHVGLALLPRQSKDPNVRAMAGASNKVFDYLACGLPVLVSDTPDNQKLFVDAGLARSCDPDDAKSIASQFLWFLENPLRSGEMSKRGIRKILVDWNYEKQFQPVLDTVLHDLSRKVQGNV